MKRLALRDFLIGQVELEGSAGEQDAQEVEDEVEGDVLAAVEVADDAAWEPMEELGAIVEEEETRWRQQVALL